MSIDRVEFEEMLERASLKGAQEALRQAGLADEHAMKDMVELRDILETWRLAKRSAIKAFWHWVTIGVLSLIAGAVWLKHGRG